MPQVKLFVVDDSEALRERLAAASAEVSGLDVIGLAGNQRDAFAGIRRLCPDVVVLDIHMPDGNGIHLLEAIKRETPTLIVIMFTNHDLPQYRKHCGRAGADYFFAKSNEFPRLVKTLRKLARSIPAVAEAGADKA